MRENQLTNLVLHKVKLNGINPTDYSYLRLEVLSSNYHPITTQLPPTYRDAIRRRCFSCVSRYLLHFLFELLFSWDLVSFFKHFVEVEVQTLDNNEE